MLHPLTARRQAQPIGVIETLSAGYLAVNRHLWVLLLPIVLDVFLWLGPQVSYSPLVGPAVTHAVSWTRQVAPGLRGVPRVNAVVNGLEAGRQWAIARTDETNGLAALAWGPIALPSPSIQPAASDDVAFVSGWADGLALLVPCVALGLLLGAWYYRGLAAASMGTRGGPLAAGRGTPRAVLDVLGLVAVVCATAAFLGGPLLLLIGVTDLVSEPMAILWSVLVLGGVLFAAVHLFFAVDAIFVSDAGPLAAIQASVGLVRRHLRPSVGLILLTWLILAGMTRVWDLLASNLQSPYGVGLSIVGNAYIASGLIAAGMIFYTQRAGQPAEHP